MRTLDRNMIMKFLAGQASPEEAELIEQWLNSSGRNKKEFNRLWQLWSGTSKGAAYATPDPGQAWTQLKSHMETPAQTQPHKPLPSPHAPVAGMAKLLAVAGGLAITATLVVHRLTKHPSPAPATSSGFLFQSGDSVIRDTLTDHVIVTLDQHTAIRNDSRSPAIHSGSTLLQGKAYVQAATAQPPFALNAGGLTIHAAGGSFLLALDTAAEKLTIHLFTGAVVLADNNKTWGLSGGRRFSYDLHAGHAVPESQVATESSLDSNEIAFSTGIYTFRNSSITEITDILTKAYKVNIRLKNPAIGNCRMTVQFDNLSLDQIMDIIAATLDLTYTKQEANKTIIIDGHGCD